jgi:hypothetical protein
MSNRIGGVGVGLPLPAFKYPSELNNAAPDCGNAYISLAPGDSMTIPAGDWIINRSYSFIQYQDTVNGGVWRGFATPLSTQEQVYSDGVNVRIANLTGCPVAAIVTVGGSGYAQSSTTVTSSTGGSTWQAVVGGMMSVNTIANAGSGYGVAPLLLIPQPAAPGVAATGFTSLTGGSVTGVTLTNVGAGYGTVSQTLIVVPNPYDPNLTSSTAIVPATVVLAPIGAGSVAAVLCTNNGAPASPTLTIAGAGASAAATAVVCQTMASGSVAAAGAGFTGGGGVTTMGGVSAATPQWTNPATDLSGAIPRPAQATLATGSGTLVSISTIIDKGLFFGTPTVLVVPGAGNLQTTTASVTIALGSTADTILLQPA